MQERNCYGGGAVGKENPLSCSSWRTNPEPCNAVIFFLMSKYREDLNHEGACFDASQVDERVRGGMLIDNQFA